MPITTDQLKEKFGKFDNYKELDDRYADKVLQILMNTRFPIHVRGLEQKIKKQKIRMSNRFLHAALDWLCKHEFLKTKKERKKKIVELTEKGKEAFEYLSAPKYDCIEFEVDGERRGKIKILIKNKDGNAVSLKSYELGILLDMAIGRIWFLGGIFYLNTLSHFARQKDMLRLEVESKLSERNLHVGALESILWAFFTHVVYEELPWVVGESYIKEFDQNYLQDSYSQDKEQLKPLRPLFQRLVKEEKARATLAFSDMGDLRLSSTFYSDIPNSWPPMVGKAYKRYWIKQTQRVRKELKKKGDFSIENYLPQMVIKVLKDPKCRPWIERRLAENPNYFMPGFFWSKLGFKPPRSKELDASLPYNTFLSKPKFVLILRDLMWPFEFMVNASRVYFTVNQRGKIDLEKLLWSPAVLIKYPQLLMGAREFDFEKMAKDAFDEFIDMMKKYQHTEDFYEAWRVIGQHAFMIGQHERELVRNGAAPAERLESFSLFFGKDLMIFTPIQEALIQYIAAGRTPVVNLAQIYSDLWGGKLETLMDAIEAIEQGRYKL
jgi:DNA-binding PadR family transcriptional regulator